MLRNDFLKTVNHFVVLNAFTQGCLRRFIKEDSIHQAPITDAPDAGRKRA
jgi:hypothetical protein